MSTLPPYKAGDHESWLSMGYRQIRQMPPGMAGDKSDSTVDSNHGVFLEHLSFGAPTDEIWKEKECIVGHICKGKGLGLKKNTPVYPGKMEWNWQSHYLFIDKKTIFAKDEIDRQSYQ